MSVARCSRSLPRHNTLHSPPPRSTPGRPSSRMARARAGRRRGGGVHTGRTPGSARCARTAWRRPCPRARRCRASPGCRRRGGQSRWTYLSIKNRSADHSFLGRFRLLRNRPRSFGATFRISGAKTEKTAKERRKDEQKWARYGLRKRARAAVQWLRGPYTSRARSTAPGTRRAACATAMVASIPKSTTQMAAYRFSHSLLWPIRPVLRMMPKSWSHSAPSAMKAHSAKKPCRVP